MSISSAIHAARSGLQITSLRAGVVATNVSNAATPGYVRRSVIVGESVYGGQTAGVKSDGIGRAANDVLTTQRRALSSDLAQAGVLSSTWHSISTRVGDSLENGSLFNLFANFENNLSAAVLSPESSSQATALLDSAKSIVREFNALHDMTISLRKEADFEISQGVNTVNSALKQIEALNGKIASAPPGSSQEAALLDERQRVLDTVAEYLPIQTVERQGGTVDVLTVEGVYLVSGKARQLEFTPSANLHPSQTLAGGNLSGITIDGIELTPGTNSFGAVSSGMFGALFQLRDQDLPAFSAQLDTIAEDLVARLSDDAIDPTKTPGEFGLFIDPDAPAGTGLAGRLAINPAIDPAQGGEVFRLRDGIGAITPGPTGSSTILQNMLTAITSVRGINANGIQGSFSSTEMIAQFSSIVGQKRVGQDAVLSSVSAQHNLMADAEQTESGVDIDAQMQDLLMIEQAYSANARVIEVASQMLDRLMEL